jgi:hypothetical protein
MQDELVMAEAPVRQLRGVQGWREDIAAAVSAGRLFKRPAGMRIDDNHHLTLAGGWARPPQVKFIYGDPTHRAWVTMCRGIVNALGTQQAHAAQLVEAALARAAAVKRRNGPGDRKRMAAALTWAAIAESWGLAAAAAANEGRYLIRREDKIMRPVGVAVARAGGINQVARDKHYHQGSTGRTQ